MYEFSFEHSDGNWGFAHKCDTLKQAKEKLNDFCKENKYNPEDFELATIVNKRGYLVWNLWAGSPPIPNHIRG